MSALLLVALAITVVLRGFLVMLGLGVAHSVIPEVPALGYGAALLLSLAMALVFPGRARVEVKK